MSLYYDTAPFLKNDEEGSSLKSRVYATNGGQTKSQPKQIYALASEASQWSLVLSAIIENCDLLNLEHKLTPELALLLVHDLLFNKRGISAPASHPLREAVERHKTRLNAELVKIRVKRKCATIDGFRNLVRKDYSQAASTAGDAATWLHPRWARLNTVKTSLNDELKSTLADFTQLANLEELLQSLEAQVFCIDEHIPNLLAFPPTADLSKSAAYLDGRLILQDKASCFPAYLLNPQSLHGDCIDTCAAPGNKTTHLAAQIAEQESSHSTRIVHAFERDTRRTAILGQMIDLAGVAKLVKIHGSQDFLMAKPRDDVWKDVTSLLLDPSCSGSGIVSRDAAIAVTLPALRGHKSISQAKKRKREPSVPKGEGEASKQEQNEGKATEIPADKLAARLTALSSFQLKLLLHAFEFPAAQRITYSTCSMYDEENEHIVQKALQSDVARRCGWHILPRTRQVEGLKRWHLRGSDQAFRDVAPKLHDHEVLKLAQACIRCEKGTEDGTQGFFVAAFTRDLRALPTEVDDEDEWQGCA